LRSLAHAKGGDLTINPHTGLPEAGFLDDVIKVAAPIALGAFLGPAGAGIFETALGAAGAVGGITTLATGSLSRGLMAGLGAYGGAGLAGSLSTAGEAALESGAGLTGANALGQEAGLSAVENAGTIAGKTTMDSMGNFITTPTVANVGDEALAANQAATEAVKPLAQQATPWEKISSGVKTITQSPSALGNFAANNWKSGLAALAPAAVASMQNTGAKTAPPVDTGYIRQKIYDPVTHHMIDLPAVKASEWGNRSFSDIYQQPTTAATGGIVALAQGGVAHFDGTDGSAVTADAAPAAPASTGFSNQQISDYVKGIQAQGGGDKEIAAAMDKFGVSTGQLAGALGMNVGDVQSRYNAADTTGGYYTGASGISNNQIRDYLSTPGLSDAAIATAMQQFKVDPTQMAYATGIPLTGEGNIADRYALAQDIMGQGKILGAYQGPGTPMQNLGSTYDQQWAAYMDAHKDPVTGKLDPIAVDEMARVTGISKDEIGKRYAAAEAILHPVKTDTKTDTKTTTGTGLTSLPAVTTTTQLPTTPMTNAPAGTSYPYGNKNTPGDITKNADGTITVHPNEPGEPYGGWSGMNEVKGAWTAGGGSTGYFPQAPKTAAEADAQFNTMTGDSLAAYNFLMGKGAAPLKTTAPQVSKSYAESVLGVKPDVPTYASNVQYIFDPVTHKRTLNPNYQTSTVTGTPGTAGSTLKLPSGGTATFDTTAKLYYLNGKYYDASGKEVQYEAPQYAAGGVAGYALGGLGSLGGYSDGGRLLRGPGDGVSDSIPASIGDRQPARLADGEFVVPARIVSEIGNGSTEAGARKLYQMMDRVQHARRKTTGKDKVATNTDAAKYLPA
jgi:hypothetical protein